jgi:hypothetical protein
MMGDTSAAQAAAPPPAPAPGDGAPGFTQATRGVVMNPQDYTDLRWLKNTFGG